MRSRRNAYPSVVPHQKRSIVVALASAAGGTVAAYLAFIFIGMVTGVIAMCAFAPEWWARIYPAFAVLIPLTGIYVAIRARRAYLRRHAAR